MSRKLVWIICFTLTVLVAGHAAFSRYQENLILNKIPNRPPKIFTVHNWIELNTVRQMTDFPDFINLKPGNYEDHDDRTLSLVKASDDFVRLFGCQNDY